MTATWTPGTTRETRSWTSRLRLRQGREAKTGLRFPRSGRPDNADPVEGAPTWVTYAVDVIKKGGQRRRWSFRT